MCSEVVVLLVESRESEQTICPQIEVEPSSALLLGVLVGSLLGGLQLSLPSVNTTEDNLNRIRLNLKLPKRNSPEVSKILQCIAWEFEHGQSSVNPISTPRYSHKGKQIGK